MALTVFCPQAKEHGPCQTPVECSARLMCAHLQAMLDRYKEQQESQPPPQRGPLTQEKE